MLKYLAITFHKNIFKNNQVHQKKIIFLIFLRGHAKMEAGGLVTLYKIRRDIFGEMQVLVCKVRQISRRRGVPDKRFKG